MEYNQQDHTNAILLIAAYLKMENESLEANKKLIKSIVHSTKFDHLMNSWTERNNDFGSFYLNLDHKTQCQFAIHWGIQIPEYVDYLTELKRSPYASTYTNPPLVISKLHEMVKFFFNNGIEAGVIPGFNLPKLPTEKYGNSTNWGTYILSLSDLQQNDVLLQITNQTIDNIKQSDKNRLFLKKAVVQH